MEYLKRSILVLDDTLKRQNVNVFFHGEEVIVYSDPGLFHQIIENLTTNVLKYAYDDDGGYIDITLDNTEHAITLYFVDYGRGISASHIPQIFDAFFTTGGGRGGTGLGLDIVYRIITTQLNGTITCESKEGSGTTFTLTIPKKSLTPINN